MKKLGGFALEFIGFKQMAFGMAIVSFCFSTSVERARWNSRIASRNNARPVGQVCSHRQEVGGIREVLASSGAGFVGGHVNGARAE